MKSAAVFSLLAFIGVSIALTGMPQAFAQVDDAEEEAQEMPKPDDVSPARKGAPPPRIKSLPSVKTAPIEPLGKGQPIVKKKPSVEATPIEIPDAGTATIKQQPSIIRPAEPTPQSGPALIAPPPPRGTTP